jgi:phage shock protein PspC (stress-responsive transcriptional regulator)
MICRQCQKEIADGSNFCYFCGASMAPPNAQVPAPAAGPAPAGGEPRRLLRSVRDRKLGGVCAGLAEYLDLDVSLVRVLTIVLIIPYGIALWAYLAAWMIVPEAQPGTEPPPLPPGRRLHRSLTDRKIGGVCGGVAEYFGLDPSIMRIVWVASVVCFGIGFFSYFLLWLILPLGEEPAAGVQSAA